MFFGLLTSSSIGHAYKELELIQQEVQASKGLEHMHERYKKTTSQEHTMVKWAALGTWRMKSIFKEDQEERNIRK